MIAALEERQGARVLLTPLACDGGIDVIAMREREVRLIQCKHTLWGASVDANVVAEVIQAFDGYRARWLRPLSGTSVLRAVLVTNGTFTVGARMAEGAQEIQLIADANLWRLLDATPCTLADIEIMESRRLASMRDVQAAMEQMTRSGA